jgi:two-component system, NarL family, invasion response regulator UvrY
MIQILAADDHAIVRKGLKQILAENQQMEVAGEASTAKELFEKLQSKPWDLLMLDISLPDQSGVEVLGRVRELYPAMPVLVLSVHDDVQYAVRMLQQGAAGYLTKESAPRELLNALQRVVNGGKYVSHALAQKLLLDFSSQSEKPHHENLSKRELQVLSLIASGKSVKEVGHELDLSVKTISTHRVRILKKMGMKHNAELIRYALDNGLAT